MAPASLRKMGSSYDLATAIGLLAADGTLAPPRLADVLLVGELALDGTVRPVSGVLPMMLMARRSGLHGRSSLPRTPRKRRGRGRRRLSRRVASEAVDLAAGCPPSPPRPRGGAGPFLFPTGLTTAGTRPSRARIAAAGGHNLLFVGRRVGQDHASRAASPACCRASRGGSPGDVRDHSAAGARLDVLLAERPFRAPHHTASRRRGGRGGIPAAPGRSEPRAQRRAVPRRAARFPRNVLERCGSPRERTSPSPRARHLNTAGAGPADRGA